MDAEVNGKEVFLFPNSLEQHHAPADMEPCRIDDNKAVEIEDMECSSDADSNDLLPIPNDEERSRDVSEGDSEEDGESHVSHETIAESVSKIKEKRTSAELSDDSEASDENFSNVKIKKEEEPNHKQASSSKSKSTEYCLNTKGSKCKGSSGKGGDSSSEYEFESDGEYERFVELKNKTKKSTEEKTKPHENQSTSTNKKDLNFKKFKTEPQSDDETKEVVNQQLKSKYVQLEQSKPSTSGTTKKGSSKWINGKSFDCENVETTTNRRNNIDNEDIDEDLYRKEWWMDHPVPESDICTFEKCTFEPGLHEKHNRAWRNMSLYEKKILLKYLIMNEAIPKAKGIQIYENMIKDGYLTHRTAETLRNCFRRTIFTNFDEFKLPYDIAKELLKQNQKGPRD